VLGDQAVPHGGFSVHVAKVGFPLVHRGFPSWMPLDLLTGFRWNAWRLRRVVRRIQPDLVHAHGTEAAYALAGLASGRPCLISIQGIVTEYQKTNPSFRFNLIQRWEQAQVRRARYFTCRTAFDTGFVRSFNPSARIFTIQEAMHEVYFGPEWKRPEQPNLMFVGSPAPRKGLTTLLTALPKVQAGATSVSTSSAARQWASTRQWSSLASRPPSKSLRGIGNLRYSCCLQ
jgi:glycosyltransferase involved in cell wall biosynthesis